MNPCAICQKSITIETNSKEHLFPNAVGGRKKVPGFICRRCNSDAGKDWDAELARQLNPISLILGIKRERGKPPPQEFSSTSGKSYIHQSDGNLTLPKPIVEETASATGKDIHVTARDIRELKAILTGLKKKYPHIDEIATLKQVTTTTFYPKDLLHISIEFNGKTAGRSVVKTALALAVQSGIAASDCEAACEYLRDRTMSARWDFYPFDPIENRPLAMALHCVAIQGKGGKLVGYVEYFGVWRMWIPLSDHYTGANTHASYAVNPMNGEELKLSVGELPLRSPDLANAKTFKLVEDSLNTVLAPVMKAARDRELSRVLREAWSRACERMNVKPGDLLSKEFAAQIAKEMTPFLEHQLRNPFADFRPER